MKYHLILAVLAAGALWTPAGANDGLPANVAHRAPQRHWKAFNPVPSEAACGSCADQGKDLEAAQAQVTDLTADKAVTVPVAIRLLRYSPPGTMSDMDRKILGKRQGNGAADASAPAVTAKKLVGQCGRK